MALNREECPALARSGILECLRANRKSIDGAENWIHFRSTEYGGGLRHYTPFFSRSCLHDDTDCLILGADLRTC
jgi:hypothetical protein